MTKILSKVASAFTVLALVAAFVPTTTFAAASILTEEFTAVDASNGASYTGVSVGFQTVDITDATAVTVTLTREDGTSVTKTANQGVLDIINAAIGDHKLTTPFVIAPGGSFTEAGDVQYWNAASAAVWDSSTRPESVRIDITTTSAGVVSATNFSFTDGSPTYTSLVPAATSARVDSEAEFDAAIADMNITTITVDGNFSVSSALSVTRPVTILGNDKTITGNFVKSDNSNNSVILITASDVVVSNLVVDGGGATNQLHGFNVYQATNVDLTSVTARNARAGVIVNGSEVEVANVTTSGNAWGGINVDQGTGVLTPATLTISGTSAHSETGPAIWKDDNTKVGVSVIGALEQYTQSIQTVGATQGTLYFLSTVNNETELSSALANTAIPTITIGSSFSVNAPVAVNRAVAIDGNEKTLSAGSSLAGHVILVTGSDVHINDLTVDGNNKSVHGIQAYVATDVSLENVTVMDNGKSGLLVNGSTVTVNNLSTSGNGWNGVNVDQGSGVTSAATLTVNGVSSHDEDDGIPAIWVDDNAKVLVSVVDTNNQYTATVRSYEKNAVTITGTEYFLTPAPVVEEDDNNNGGGSGRSGSGRRNVNTNSNANDNASVTGQVNSTTPGQGQVLGASTYNFTVDLSYGSTGADVNALHQLLIDAGYLKIPAPTGWFGPMTRAALAQWQAAHGVAPAVGYFGPITRAAIIAANAAATPTTTPASE